MIIRKSASEIEQMERAAQVVAETLQLVADHVVPGITTEEQIGRASCRERV